MFWWEREPPACHADGRESTEEAWSSCTLTCKARPLAAASWTTGPDEPHCLEQYLLTTQDGTESTQGVLMLSARLLGQRRRGACPPHPDTTFQEKKPPFLPIFSNLLPDMVVSTSLTSWAEHPQGAGMLPCQTPGEAQSPAVVLD